MKIKRLFDITITAISLIILFPIIGLIALLVRLYIGRPVVFRQFRRGLQGRCFVIYKFRTMLEQYDTQGKLLPDAQRVTALGNWLRSTSLDELPQLWNVFKGEMSLVGPRPLSLEQLTGQLAHHTTIHAYRDTVLPGITGWAQINGRNALSMEEKLALDLWYIKHRTIWLDLKILLLTVKPVLLRRNI